jgi:hypothetical protein
MERYMLVEAVRTNVVMLFDHLCLTDDSISLVTSLSIRGWYVDSTLIACFVRAHSCLLRYHPIVADHTREGIRALARSIQRKLEIIFIHIGVDRLVSQQHIAFIFVPEVYDRNPIAHKPPTTQ